MLLEQLFIHFIQEDTDQDRDYQFKECLFILLIYQRDVYQFVDPSSEFFYEDIITVHYLPPLHISG